MAKVLLACLIAWIASCDGFLIPTQTHNSVLSNLTTAKGNLSQLQHYDDFDYRYRYYETVYITPLGIFAIVVGVISCIVLIVGCCVCICKKPTVIQGQVISSFPNSQPPGYTAMYDQNRPPQPMYNPQIVQPTEQRF